LVSPGVRLTGPPGRWLDPGGSSSALREAAPAIRRKLLLGARCHGLLGARYDGLLGAPYDVLLGARYDGLLGARYDVLPHCHRGVSSCTTFASMPGA
jgi:hypothetical protein